MTEPMTLLIVLQAFQVVVIVGGGGIVIFKLGRWAGEVNSALEQNQRDHDRYDQHLSQS